MWYQFVLENVHFTINIFSALVFFGIFWLYFDAWRVRKSGYLTFRIIGLLGLTLSFLVSAAQLEATILPRSIMGAGLGTALFEITRLAGYVFLFVSVLLDPLEPMPKELPRLKAKAIIGVGTLALPLSMLHPILASAIAFLYLRRATIGLENHIKPVSLAFFLLAVSELLSMATLFQTSAIISVYQLVAPFGVIWYIEHIILLFSIAFIGKWVFGYLLKQFETQLFMIFTTTILIIFLVTTVSFTGLLVKNVQDESLRQLETDVKVLSFSLESKKNELTSDAQLLAQNPVIVTSTKDQAKQPLTAQVEDFLLTKKQSTVVVVGEGGQVLARGEDRDRVGDSLSNDPLVKRALLGEVASSVVTSDGVTAPAISLRASVPVKDDTGVVIGAVLVGSAVDSAYVDGLKKTTGLDSSIYGDNAVSATTFMAPDGKTRLTGMKEEHSVIKTTVLGNGEPYTGSVTILSNSYFASFLPLKDVDNVPVGMLFVGRPQVHVLAAAGKSIELTFLVTAALLVLSVFPSYAVSKFLSNQLE
jgi:Single cache domain 3